MAKIIKEIIILLIICLILMLIFAIVLYDYIPNRKTVKQVAEYTASQDVQALLEDNIDSEDKEIIKTYEVSSSDLTNYSVRKEYVKGKDNPFASIEAHENEKNKTNTGNKSDNSSNNSTSETENNEKDNNNDNSSSSNSSNESTNTQANDSMK